MKKFLGITKPKGWVWIGIGIASFLWGYLLFKLFEYLFLW